MLVYARKARQAIVIGENIEITVLEITGTLVRLGISAPRDVPVMRAEKAAERREFTLPLSRFMPVRKAG